MGKMPGQALQAQGPTETLNPRIVEGRSIAAIERDGILEPVVQARGVKLVVVPTDEENSTKNRRYHKDLLECTGETGGRQPLAR